MGTRRIIINKNKMDRASEPSRALEVQVMNEKGLMPNLKTVLDELNRNPIAPQAQAQVPFRMGVHRVNHTMDASGINDTEAPDGFPQDAQRVYAAFMSGVMFVTGLFKPGMNNTRTAEQFAADPLPFIINMADVCATAVEERYTGKYVPEDPAKTLLDAVAAMLKTQLAQSVQPQTIALVDPILSDADLDRMFALPDPPEEKGKPE
jgi:hypothetical protein